MSIAAYNRGTKMLAGACAKAGQAAIARNDEIAQAVAEERAKWVAANKALQEDLDKARKGIAARDVTIATERKRYNKAVASVETLWSECTHAIKTRGAYATNPFYWMNRVVFEVSHADPES